MPPRKRNQLRRHRAPFERYAFAFMESPNTMLSQTNDPVVPTLRTNPLRSETVVITDRSTKPVMSKKANERLKLRFGRSS